MKKSLFSICIILVSIFSTTSAQAPLGLGVSGQNPKCTNDNSGVVTVTANGGTTPYAYQLNNSNSATGTFNNLSAGHYSIIVTDATGMTATGSINLVAPPAIVLSLQSTNSGCNNPGAVNASVSGGKPGYTFAWNNGATTQNLTNVPSGNYTVTVTDANGCTAISTATVASSGGLGPISISPLAVNSSGGYSVILTDANGCTTTAIVDIDMAPCPPTFPAGTNFIFAQHPGWSPSTNSVTICTNTPVTLTCTKNDLQYDWHQVPSVGDDQTVTLPGYSAPGDYLIFLETWTYLNIIHTFFFTVHVTNCLTGEDDLESGKIGVEVSPNPATDQVAVVISEPGQYSFKLFNSLGQLVQQTEGGSETEVPLDGFASGIYLLQIFSENGKFIAVEKILKE